MKFVTLLIVSSAMAGIFYDSFGSTAIDNLWLESSFLVREKSAIGLYLTTSIVVSGLGDGDEDD